MILATTLVGFGLSDFLWLSGVCALTALMMLWRRTRRIQRIQCVIFAAVGFCALGWAYLIGYRNLPLLQLITQNHLLISLLSAVSFLRLITDTGQEKHESAAPGLKAFFKTLAGLHLFAAMINLSALMIFGDRLARNGRLSAPQPLRSSEVLHWPLCGRLFSPRWARACFTRRALDWLSYGCCPHHYACLVSFLPLPNIASVRVERWKPLKVSR